MAHYGNGPSLMPLTKPGTKTTESAIATAITTATPKEITAVRRETSPNFLLRLKLWTHLRRDALVFRDKMSNALVLTNAFVAYIVYVNNVD